MKFWKKFWFIVFLSLIFFVLRLSTPEIGHLEFSIVGNEVSIGIYALFSILLLFWLVCFSIKAFFVLFVSLFFRNKTANDIRATNELARLIVSDDADFDALFDKTYTTENMKPLKMAIAVNRGFLGKRAFDKTGLHCIDIYIIKQDLNKFIKNGDINSAIGLANKVIKNYVNDINVVRDEILEIAKLAKKRDLHFSFDPRKFKYNLPQKFIAHYFSELDFVEFDLEPNAEKKLKLIERMAKNYPDDFQILFQYVELAFQNNVEEKKILEVIKNHMSQAPNRGVARILLRFNRNDVFELAQSYMAHVSNQNLEKLWILLIIATEKEFGHLMTELIQKIVQIDKSNDLERFYIENHEKLCTDEFVALIRKEEI